MTFQQSNRPNRREEDMGRERGTQKGFSVAFESFKLFRLHFIVLSLLFFCRNEKRDKHVTVVFEFKGSLG